MGNPPPLPLGDGDSPNSGIFRQAATLSLIIPTVIGVLGRLVSTLLNPDGSDPIRMLALVLAGLGAFAILIGLAFGLAAATGARGEDSGRVRGRGALGAILNSILLAVAVVGFQSGRQKAQASTKALGEVREIIQTAEKKQAKAIERGDASTLAKLGNDALNAVKGKIEVAAREAPSGTGTKSTLEAAGAYLEKLQKLTKDYEDRLAALQKIDAINPAKLHDRAELAPRRLAIRAFLDSNESLKTFMIHAEERMIEEMNARQVPERQQNAFLESFRKGKPRHETVVKIRGTDDRIGEGMLAILLLYEQEWGDWNYETSSQRVLFQDEKALKRFESLSGQLSDAAEEQKNLQRRLSELPPIQ